MTKEEIFEKFNPSSLGKGQYLIFLCESEGVVILNIDDILKIDEDNGETIMRTSVKTRNSDNQNYYPHLNTLTYINL